MVKSATKLVYFANLQPNWRADWRESLNPLSANTTKWLNTLKKFAGNSRRIVWVYLTILWDLHLKG